MSEIGASAINLKEQSSHAAYFFLHKNRFYFNAKHKAEVDTQQSISSLVQVRLKIAIVTETWPPEINGVALSLLQLCLGLKQRGHELLLIRPKQNQICTAFTADAECLVRSQALPRYSELQWGWPQYLKIAKAIEQFKPDVVHIVTEGPLGLAALYVAQAQRIPVSSGFHSSFQDFGRFFDLACLVKPIQQYLRWFHNHTHMTCVPSMDTQTALRQFGVTCPIMVVGRGVNLEQFSAKYYSTFLRQQWQVQDDTTVMLYVGRLSPEKEIEVIIQGFISLQKQSVRAYLLVIVGDGPDRSRLVQLADQHNIIFTGSLTGQALAQVYASADVFVFASQVETFGNVVLEAMASGLPVVAYRYACAGQYVQHEVSGWLSPLGDLTQFIQYLQHLPARKQLKEMGVKATQHIQHTSWQKSVNDLEQALYQVSCVRS